MRLSRRAVLGGLASAGFADAKGLLVEAALSDTVSAALEAAKRGGASYADVRLHRRRAQDVAARDDHVERVSDVESYGVGVRVLVEGVWGFAAAPVVSPASAQAVAARALAVAAANQRLALARVELAPAPARVDLWQTPLTKDPFRVPVEDKAALLLELCRRLRSVRGVPFASARISSRLEWKLFASSEGALLEQRIVRMGPDAAATAVDPTTGEFMGREWDGQPRQAGWEWLEESGFTSLGAELAEEALEKLKAPSVAPGKKTLVLAPTNLFLTIHESVGHPTELDRALGHEANFAGTSFATPDLLGTLQYAAPQVTLFADRTTPGGLASCAYDDDGVPTGRWNLVERGRFVGYQTTREQAGWIGERASRGCAYAQDYASVAFQRMPNVSLAPDERGPSLAQLIADTDDGLLITGTGSWSIDHQRYNFQFSGQSFRTISKGKLGGMVRDVAYQSNTPDFWRACDRVGGPQDVALCGVFDDGKGEPFQSNPVSHGCPPARFRGVNVLNTRGAP